MHDVKTHRVRVDKQKTSIFDKCYTVDNEKRCVVDSNRQFEAIVGDFAIEKAVQDGLLL